MSDERQTRRDEPAAPTPQEDTDTAPSDEAVPLEEEGQPAATVPDSAMPTPGESPGASIPEVHAVQADAADGEVRRVRGVAHAPPGKPDGEVDTRP